VGELLMSNQRYAVSVVHLDLPPAEAIHQIIDNLKQLENVVGDLFGKLSAQIRSERTKIQDICQRVSNAQARVGRVAVNQSKATTVYSTNRYPAAKVLPDFHRIASVDEPVPQPFTAVQHSNYNLSLKERRALPDSTSIAEMFASLSAPLVGQYDPTLTQDLQEGLGRLPSYFPAIGSILLFNSSENPYKKYVTLDNLEGEAGKDREKIQRELAAAPQSLFDGSRLPAYAKPQFMYSPDLGDVPTFDVPQNLPLARVADIRFDADPSKTAKSIAPSVAALPGLPSIEQFQALAAPTERKKQFAPAVPAPPAAPSVASSSAIPAPPSTFLGGAEIPVPPPIPASPSIPVPPPLASSIPVPPPVAPSIPAPPPAPPVPPTGAPSGPSSTSSSLPAVAGDRGDLLAAIRNPNNLKRLRSVKSSTDAPSHKSKVLEKKAAAKAAETTDMMTALRRKLELRRQATSNRADKADSPRRPRKARKAADASDDEDDEVIPKVPSLSRGGAGKKGGGAGADGSDSEW